MTSPRRLAALPILLIALFALSSCVAIAKPEGWAMPALKDGTLYYARNTDHLSAAKVNADGTLTSLWTFPSAEQDKNEYKDKKDKLSGIYGTPVISGDTLYFSSYQAGVFALNTTDGKMKWKFTEYEGHVTAGVGLSDGTLLFGTSEGQLLALDAATGGLAKGWPKDGLTFGHGIWAAPVIQNGVAFVASMDGTVDAIKVTDGSRAWPKPFKSTGAVPALQMLDTGHLFVPSLNRYTYLLNPANGEIITDFKTKDWVWGGAAVANGVAYFGDFSGYVYALDITSGQNLWKETRLADARIKGGPAVSGDTVVFADRGPEGHDAFTAYFLNAKDGTTIGAPVPMTGRGTVRADVAATDKGVWITTTKGALFSADVATQTIAEITPGAAK